MYSLKRKDDGGWKERGRVGDTACCSLVGLKRGGFIAIPRALSGCDYMVEKKKSVLLSVCKGNENLMRLDFFFFSPQRSQLFDSRLHNRFPEEKHTRGGRNG